MIKYFLNLLLFSTFVLAQAGEPGSHVRVAKSLMYSEEQPSALRPIAKRGKSMKDIINRSDTVQLDEVPFENAAVTRRASKFTEVLSKLFCCCQPEKERRPAR